jgi:hypothetical protein
MLGTLLLIAVVENTQARSNQLNDIFICFFNIEHVIDAILVTIRLSNDLFKKVEHVK